MAKIGQGAFGQGFGQRGLQAAVSPPLRGPVPCGLSRLYERCRHRQRIKAPRQTLMNFRATPDERQQMQALAVAHGTTLSDLIRRGLQLQGFEPQR